MRAKKVAALLEQWEKHIVIPPARGGIPSFHRRSVRIQGAVDTKEGRLYAGTMLSFQRIFNEKHKAEKSCSNEERSILMICHFLNTMTKAKAK